MRFILPRRINYHSFVLISRKKSIKDKTLPIRAFQVKRET